MPADNIQQEVFEWLGEGLGPSTYLWLLRPRRDERTDLVLANLRIVAARLRDQPTSWSELIRAQDWRPTLVGCCAILVMREGSFLDDLLYRFREGSWVSPQLAVALAIVHPNEARAEFESEIRAHTASARIKEIFSAYAALRILRSEVAREFEASDLFQHTRTESAVPSDATNISRIAESSVQGMWDFWSSQSW